MITASLLAQTAKTPLTKGAAEIFEVGRQTSEAISADFDVLWLNVLNGGLYKAVADVGILLAVLSLGLFLVQWAGQMMYGEGDKAYTELIWPLIVVVLLSGDGAVLSSVILELRSVGNQINNSVLVSAVLNESLQVSYQQARSAEALENTLSVSIAECVESQPPPQQSTCIEKARQAHKEQRQQLDLPFDEQDSWLGSALQFVIRNLLWAFHSAFQWSVELVLLITSLLAPLAMGLSLLPSRGKPIIAWLSGFSGVFLIKLNFNLISGLAAYAVSLSGFTLHSLLLPVLLGVMAPILAVVVGLQGGVSLFNALSTAGIYAYYRAAGSVAGKTLRGGPRLLRSRRRLK
ncbi:hypothetical protein PN498_13235 [Oscillatoria sp. CS-180]|uniref:hypothetical protein n=1 Tax=Oscillatoria sp. CS-180 TaxID=3021720 RepID=UPI00233065A4|nr:hypothetical protein [Oscillatoria sp. CS-180]MDB9526957.1 hypothetical protein [Oscillatoria sp. CS-180]